MWFSLTLKSHRIPSILHHQVGKGDVLWYIPVTLELVLINFERNIILSILKESKVHTHDLVRIRHTTSSVMSDTYVAHGFLYIVGSMYHGMMDFFLNCRYILIYTGGNGHRKKKQLFFFACLLCLLVYSEATDNYISLPLSY